ncbi:MAG: tRNA 2-thiouridine(34) synthase MnmA, partial [Planctomycetes bacterium]|nr:tRNA 2-thiouridine(34) synthase MnmA [Planctomycetota bacterium]
MGKRFKRIMVGMSGGVDSTVAAAMLKEQGYEVAGVFMQSGFESPNITHKQRCCSEDDAEDARKSAELIGVPFYIIDMRKGFEGIIGNFVDEYNKGRTPNPCILCNRELKFGEVMDFALQNGYEAVATGHYCQVEYDAVRFWLRRGSDIKKEQSYSLWMLRQQQLARAVFPLGGMSKLQVREFARTRNLPVFSKRESQEICFVLDNNYRNFLLERTPETIKPGEFVDIEGSVIGMHKGHQFYTIGQRRGLGIAYPHRSYVVEIRGDENVVVIGKQENLYKRGFIGTQVNWQAKKPEIGEKFRAPVQVRYNHNPPLAEIEVLTENKVK